MNTIEVMTRLLLKKAENHLRESAEAVKEEFKTPCLIEAELIGLFAATSPCHVLARVGVFPSCSAAKAPTGSCVAKRLLRLLYNLL